MGMDKKGELEWDTLVPWLIGVLFLVLAIIGYIILKGKGQGAIDFINDLLRFGK